MIFGNILFVIIFQSSLFLLILTDCPITDIAIPPYGLALKGCDSWAPDATCYIDCNADFTQYGDCFRRCKPEGFWKGPHGHKPLCVRTDIVCPVMAPIDNGVVTCDDICITSKDVVKENCQNVAGIPCSYICTEGHDRDTVNQTVFCKTDGTWSETPRCRGKYCSLTGKIGAVWKIGEDTSLSCQVLPGEKCEVECSIGYEYDPATLSRPKVATCQPNYQFDYNSADLLQSCRLVGTG